MNGYSKTLSIVSYDEQNVKDLDINMKCEIALMYSFLM